RQQNAAIGDYVNSAADGVARFSGYLRAKDVGELIDDAEEVARRQPILVIGGAFLLGFFGARFLKSSRPQMPPPERRSSPMPRTPYSDAFIQEATPQFGGRRSEAPGEPSSAR